MKWNSIKKEEAANEMEKWSPGPEKIDSSALRPEDAEIREALLEAWEGALDALGIREQDLSKETYKFDLAFGLRLFEELCIKRGMTPRTASDAGVWRHMSVNVAPDLVHSRWGNNPSRFWKEPRRIWLKSLWWYIYLSWQGSIEETFEILKSNTTDEVVQLVERAGKSGYRTELYRSIMKYYGNMDKSDKPQLFQLFGKKSPVRSSGIFRKVMVLNTARVKVIEPSLVEGGEDKYVRDLFEYFEKK